MTTTLTDDDRIELEARRRADELLTDAVAGVSIGYLMMKVKALEDWRDGIGARVGSLESKAARHDVEIPKLQSALSKARDTFAKLAARTDDPKPPAPQPAKGAKP